MNFPFHYYGTFCAAKEAGFDTDDAWEIAHSAQFVDECSKGLLEKHGKKGTYPTYHTNSELLKMNVGWFGSSFPNEIPQVWTSFHFLPGNLDENDRFRIYYRNPNFVGDPVQTELFKLTCLPYGRVSGMIVDAALEEYAAAENKDKNKAKKERLRKLSYIGMVMHVLADTFAHEYFVGTPSEAINETSWITEFDRSDSLHPYGSCNIRVCEKKSNPSYIYSPAFSSTSVGWLGHGRIGTYPDLPNKKYYYNPNWYPEAECVKSNPHIHLCAFIQMTSAMKFIKDGKSGEHFDYSLEPTEEELTAPDNYELLTMFATNGEDEKQNQKWAEHILKKYSESPMKHDAEELAKNPDFLNNFTRNADKHRGMVCEYCREKTKNLKYFDT